MGIGHEHNEWYDNMTDKEINIARDKMQTYVSFATYQPRIQKAQFFEGAAAAINDLLCDLGHGDAVEDLIEILNDTAQ